MNSKKKKNKIKIIIHETISRTPKDRSPRSKNEIEINNVLYMENESTTSAVMVSLHSHVLTILAQIYSFKTVIRS